MAEPDCARQCTEDTLKATQPKKPVTTVESKNELTDRQPAGTYEQRGESPRRAWRSFTTIDDDWTRLERRRQHLKNALLPDREMGRTQPQRPEAVAESKYEPN